jgi:hypothetical protein
MFPRLPLHDLADHGRANAIALSQSAVRDGAACGRSANLSDEAIGQPRTATALANCPPRTARRIGNAPTPCSIRAARLATPEAAFSAGRGIRQTMPPPADVRPSHHRAWAHATPQILFRRNRLQMGRIHTGRNSAQMVNDEAIGDRAVCILPREAVRWQQLPVAAGFPIAVLGARSSPDPAWPEMSCEVRGWPVLVNLCPSSRGKSSGATDAPRCLVTERMVVDPVGANVARLDNNGGAAMRTRTLKWHRALQSLVALPRRCATTVGASSRQLYHALLSGDVVSFTPGGR